MNVAMDKVRNRGPTVVVAALKNGHRIANGATLIGGYASMPWQWADDDEYYFSDPDSDDDCPFFVVADPNAFIFAMDRSASPSSLVKKHVAELRMPPRENSERIFPYFRTLWEDPFGDECDGLEVDFKISTRRGFYRFDPDPRDKL